MNFNAPIFLFMFLPLSFFVFLLAQGRARLLAGLVAGALFYVWGNAAYLPLLAGLIAINLLLGIQVEKGRGTRAGLLWMWLTIGINLAPMVAFKLIPGLTYPLGLSYLGFQWISYIADVYKRENAERDWLKFSFYILFFPKIIVGPITRYANMRSQLDDIRPSAEGVADGIRRFVRGLAKKVLIADTLGRTVGPIFALSAPDVAPWIAWLVLLGYSLQLFFDFSGYTDMALGLARMMGLTLPENFNFPYISKNISEFWRRWHITLSTWFRDYVFYPLERRRLPVVGQALNILIVFALTGLWHGFGLTFLAWGLVHGLALVFESTPAGKWLRSAWAPLQHLYALVVILVGWVFFRSETFAYALAFFRRLAGDVSGLKPLPFLDTAPLPIVEPSFLLALAAGVLLALPLASWLGQRLQPVRQKSLVAEYGLQVVYDIWILFLLVASIAATAAGNFAPGIYGNF